jgi:hypothetical protein
MSLHLSRSGSLTHRFVVYITANKYFQMQFSEFLLFIAAGKALLA